MQCRFSNCLIFGVVYCLGWLRRTWIGLERVGLVSISLLYNINVYIYILVSASLTCHVFESASNRPRTCRPRDDLVSHVLMSASRRL
jgi:hypothetical protein